MPNTTREYFQGFGAAHLPGRVGVEILTVGLPACGVGRRARRYELRLRLRGEPAAGRARVWDAVVSVEQTASKIALFRCTQMILWPK